MKNNEFGELTRSQLVVMKCIWDKGEDISYQELISVLASRFGREYQRSTVVTFLQQLADKGYVSTHREGKFAYVHPEVSEETFKTEHAWNETNFWYQGKVSNLFSALVGKRGIPKEDRAEIQRILDSLKDEDD